MPVNLPSEQARAREGEDGCRSAESTNLQAPCSLQLQFQHRDDATTLAVECGHYLLTVVCTATAYRVDGTRRRRRHRHGHGHGRVDRYHSAQYEWVRAYA